MINIRLQKEFVEKYTNDIEKLEDEIRELANQEDKQREVLEDMLEKYKVEIERCSKDLK